MTKQAKLTLDITVEKRRIYGRGAKRYHWYARMGGITGSGATQAEARADLAACIAHVVANPTPKVVVNEAGVAVLAHAAECSDGDVCAAIIRPGATRPSGYTMMAWPKGKTLWEVATDYLASVS